MKKSGLVPSKLKIVKKNRKSFSTTGRLKRAPARNNKLNRPELPKSCTSLRINLLGVISFLLAIYIMRHFSTLSDFQKLLMAMMSYAAPIAVLECLFLKTHRRRSMGDAILIPQKIKWKRVVTKLMGFYFTLTILACAYSAFPEYQKGIIGFILSTEKNSGGFYRPFWEFLSFTMPYVLIGAIPYFIFSERFLKRSEDGYWQTGLLLTLHFGKINWEKLGQHGRGWMVKGFFLPLMYVYLIGNVNFLVTVNIGQAFSQPDRIFNFFWQLLYSIDLVIVTVGYILSVRLFDSHIRSTEPTIGGWVYAIICYQPFWSVISFSYLNYDSDRFTWGMWLFSHPTIYILWAAAIIFLTAIYAFASVSFGLRFSNLTHRGILTNGVYQFTKHPAYVSKNISWWMIAVPFVVHQNTTIPAALGSCVLLLFVNLIYFLRARTEERHLSADPVYVEYALAMNEHSIFAWLGKMFSVLQYKPHPKLVEIE